MEWGGEKPLYFCIQFALIQSASHSSAQMVSCLRERVYASSLQNSRKLLIAAPHRKSTHKQWKSWQVGASRIFVQWWSLENSEILSSAVGFYRNDSDIIQPEPWLPHNSLSSMYHLLSISWLLSFSLVLLGENKSSSPSPFPKLSLDILTMQSKGEKSNQDELRRGKHYQWYLWQLSTNESWKWGRYISN